MCSFAAAVLGPSMGRPAALEIGGGCLDVYLPHVLGVNTVTVNSYNTSTDIEQLHDIRCTAM